MFYAISSLGIPAAFLFLAVLIGRGIAAAVELPLRLSSLPTNGLVLPLGMGAAIVMLLVLAAFGALQPPWILTMLVAAGAWGARRARGRPWFDRHAEPLHPAARIAAGLGLLTAVLLALSAPLEWDALSYHLPYARSYAEEGGLVVETRLRYPLHPHHVQLLFAASLQFAAEASAQVLHSACGILTAAAVFVYARHRFGMATAVLSVLMFLLAVGSLLDAAYVDLAVALFTFYAFYALALWWEDRRDALLLMAAFLLGIAIGSKYQALVLVPVYAVALAVARPGWRLAAKAALVLLAAGSFWYLRSAWISGDPFHPMGGPWLGFWQWDVTDLAAQFADVAGRGSEVPWELLPALAFPILKQYRSGAGIALSIVGLGGGIAWWLSSGYDRYLLPSYAPLALMSAAVLVASAQRWLPDFRSLPSALSRFAPWFTLAALALALGATVEKKWDEICFTHACVDRVYDARLASRGAARVTAEFQEWRLYQLGLENELYLLGKDAAGDWFGLYRYRDLLALANDPAALANHLRRLDRNGLLVNRQRPPFDAFDAEFKPGRHFEEAYRDERVVLYRLAGH